MAIIQDLHWRYATKKFSDQKLSDEKLATIQEATRLSASSYGLQPFTIIVVKDQEVKKKLKDAAYGQPQLEDSQAVFVFTVPESITEAMVDEYIQRTAATRNVSIETLEGFSNSIKSTVVKLPQEQQQNWAAKQAYISLGTALVAAAEQKVDACPMEGFDNAQFDEILSLKEKGLKSAVIMCLGYRSEEDKLASKAKVRKESNQLFEVVG